jgi:hypothetical protein
MRLVPLGGFKSVELNLVGWIAALGPTTLIGALIGAVTSGSSAGIAIGSIVGATGGFAGARSFDALHDRRRKSNMP